MPILWAMVQQVESPYFSFAEPVPPILVQSSTMDLRNSILQSVSGKYGTILVDPPWRFSNRTGKVGPEHKRLHRYETLSFDEIARLPIPEVSLQQSHLYLWCPNALLLETLQIMKAWGFTYKTNIVWYKVRRDGGPDGRGVLLPAAFWP